jgi:hypothetical protein
VVARFRDMAAELGLSDLAQENGVRAEIQITRQQDA